MRKRRVVQRIYGTIHSWKWRKDRKRCQEQNKKKLASSVGLSKDIHSNIPTTWGEPAGTTEKKLPANILKKDQSTQRITLGPRENFIELVNWCFEASQPLWIISGLKETFIQKYLVQRANKARFKTGRKEWESGELSGEFMERNTVDRAIKPEIDTRTK